MSKITKVFIATILLVLMFSSAFTAFCAPATMPFDVEAKAALLMDCSSGTVLYEKNADQKLPIASITKVMTLCIIFDEIEQGNLKLDDMVMVSPKAANVGGSYVLTDANYSYKASELIKSIIIASANDCAAAMAEHISGTEEAFVERMNSKAAEMNMTNTTFKNCTGLPADGHLSTARDVSIMTTALMKHSDYFKWSNIWMDTIIHKDNRATELVNTNRLIRYYEGCDGGKTGYTSEAKFCISASAKRGNTRLIAVVLGGDTSPIRFAETTKLLNYGFANYTTIKLVDSTKALEQSIPLQNGLDKTVMVKPAHDFSLVVRKGEEKQVQHQTILPDIIKAPVSAGAQVGEIIITQNGIEKGRAPLIAAADYKEAKYFDYVKKILTWW